MMGTSVWILYVVDTEPSSSIIAAYESEPTARAVTHDLQTYHGEPQHDWHAIAATLATQHEYEERSEPDSLYLTRRWHLIEMSLRGGQ